MSDDDDFRPRLRSHVRLVSRDGKVALLDDVLVRRVDLEPGGAELVARLDGRPLAEIARTPVEEIMLRRLVLLNLVEGAGDPIVDRVRRVRAGEEDLGISILDGARFQCQGSGECCQNYVFGPLNKEDITRLESLDLPTAMPHIAQPYVEQTTLDDGRSMHYLRSVDDRCIFLEDDKACGLHRRFGAEAKPKLCRLYPLEACITVDGMRIYDKGSCATFAVSSRAGLPLIEDLDRVRPLLPGVTESLFHPVVEIDEYSCDFGHFDRFAKAGLQLVKRTRESGPRTLRALSRGLRHFAQTLRAFPFAPGQPDAAVDALLAGDLAQWYEGEPDRDEVQRGAFGISQIFSSLLVNASEAISKTTKEKGFLSHRILREAAQLFHVAGVLAMHVADPALPLDPYIAELVKTPVEGPDIDEVLRISIRQQLFGLDCLVDNRALAGFLRMALSQLLTYAGARLRAVNERRDRALAEDLSWGHMLASRLLRRSNAAPLLVAAEPLFSAILEALPAVIACA